MHFNNIAIVESLVIILQLLFIISGSAAVAGDDDVLFISSCLSQELRIPELLRLKMSVDKMSRLEPDQCQFIDRAASNDTNLEESEKSLDRPKSTGGDSPAALALVQTAKRRDYDADTTTDLDYHHHSKWWQYEEKPSKLQTLFQVSITALAFLSFGAYLLCLIVQAIKSKGTTYFHPVATAATTANTGVKRIKIYRRSRRNAKVLKPTDPYYYDVGDFKKLD